MTSLSDRRRMGGFTLVEMLVVIVILGVAMALVAMRGPARSRGMEARAVAADIAETLRLARTQAIAGNRVVGVVIDAAVPRIELANGTARAFPPGTGVALYNLTGPVDGTRLAIRFAPDGSANGGSVILSSGGKRFRVAAAWLTGRVSVTDVP